MAMLTQAADEDLLPALTRLQREQTALETRLRQRQQENEELAKLLHQQEQLTAESRQWLRDFDRRHTLIREAYTRLTGEALTSA
jgi:predicted nuclease with TOPRIM domain